MFRAQESINIALCDVEISMKKKKIGILTFHRSINTGAYIQCYALSRQLERDFPDAEVEIIDYCTKRVVENYTYKWFVFLFRDLKRSKYGAGSDRVLKKLSKRILSLARHPELLSVRKREWDLFKRDWERLPLSQERLITDDCDAFQKFVRHKYDVIIAGSDCIWQYESYPFPNAYFLSGELGAVKMSYAGCAYHMDLNIMDDSDKEYMRSALNNFYYLGIRDTETQVFLRGLKLDIQSHHNCDPAFLLDVNDIPVSLTKLREKLENTGVDFTKKIVGLQVNYELIGKMVREAVNDEYQIVAIRKHNKYADIFIEDLTPLEWARVFSLFSVTITDFFHGTIVSLKNGTWTISIDTEFGNKNRNNSRLCDLMKRLGMQDYYYQLNKNSIVDTIWLHTALKRIMDNNIHKNLIQIIDEEKHYYLDFKDVLKQVLQENVDEDH